MKPQDLFPRFKDWAPIVLSDHAEFVRENSRGLWVSLLEQQLGGHLYGGYLENRSIFFDHRHDPLAKIHVGIDYWLPAHTPVVFPFKGLVSYSRGPSDTIGGWGGRIDIYSNGQFYILGHLKHPNVKRGHNVEAGSIIGELADREYNGGWRPHLHLQCMERDHYFSFKHPDDIDAYAPPQDHLSFLYPDPMIDPVRPKTQKSIQ